MGMMFIIVRSKKTYPRDFKVNKNETFYGKREEFWKAWFRGFKTYFEIPFGDIEGPGFDAGDNMPQSC